MSRLERLSGSIGVILIGFATLVLMEQEDERRLRQDRAAIDESELPISDFDNKFGSVA